jgi:hypothetical protein
MKKVTVFRKRTEDEWKRFKSTHPKSSHYSKLITEESDLVDLKGKVIGGLRHNVLSKELMKDAWHIFSWVKKFKTRNRSGYAGTEKGFRKKKDGTYTRSQTAMVDGKEVLISSVPAGFMDPQGGRYPYCRPTKVTQDYPEEWAKMVRVIQRCAEVYLKEHPRYYKRQHHHVEKADPAWVIPNTPFSTIQVNNGVPAAYHQDGGDLKQGLGCMLVLRRGSFDGYDLVLPEWDISIRPRSGSLVFFDPCSWHGNTVQKKSVGSWERISVVMYFRRKLLGCGNPDEEQAKAKKRGSIWSSVG